MVSLRDGREGPLLAVHVHIAIVAVDFHVKSATVARAVDLELELVPLVSVRVSPLWVEDGVISLQFAREIQTKYVRYASSSIESLFSLRTRRTNWSLRTRDPRRP